MTISEVDFENYIVLREKLREVNYGIWVKIDEKLVELIAKTKKISPHIAPGIQAAYDDLSQGIIATILQGDFPKPKDFAELQSDELALLNEIPESIRKMFNKLFAAYLRHSTNNALIPDEALYTLLVKFRNENAELRYPDAQTNPYLNSGYRRTREPNYDWKKKAPDEFYEYYDGIITCINSIRNFHIHSEDAFTRTQFDLASRRVTDPLSQIQNPGNFIVLANLVILCAYEFIEILQIWIDTQARLGNT